MPDFFLDEQIWSGQTITAGNEVTKTYSDLPPGLLVEMYATGTDEYMSVKADDDDLPVSQNRIFISESMHRDGVELVDPYRFYTTARNMTITVKNKGSGSRVINMRIKMTKEYGESRHHIHWETLQIAGGGSHTTGYISPGNKSRLGWVVNSDSALAGTLVLKDRLNSLNTEQQLGSWSAAKGANGIIPNAFGEFQLTITNSEASGTWNYLLSVIAFD